MIITILLEKNRPPFQVVHEAGEDSGKIMSNKPKTI